MFGDALRATRRLAGQRLPRERFGSNELLRWLECTQVCSEEARRYHALPCPTMPYETGIRLPGLGLALNPANGFPAGFIAFSRSLPTDPSRQVQVQAPPAGRGVSLGLGDASPPVTNPPTNRGRRPAAPTLRSRQAIGADNSHYVDPTEWGNWRTVTHLPGRGSPCSGRTWRDVGRAGAGRCR